MPTANDLLQWAREQRKAAEVLHHVAPSMSVFEDRDMLKQHAETMKTDAARLEERALPSIHKCGLREVHNRVALRLIHSLRTCNFRKWPKCEVPTGPGNVCC